MVILPIKAVSISTLILVVDLTLNFKSALPNFTEEICIKSVPIISKLSPLHISILFKDEIFRALPLLNKSKLAKYG